MSKSKTERAAEMVASLRTALAYAEAELRRLQRSKANKQLKAAKRAAAKVA